jgi:hypothetical protein
MHKVTKELHKVHGDGDGWNESARAAGGLQLGSSFLSFSSGKHFCFYLAYFYLVI